MGVLDVESLLSPISEAAPCGPNMEYEPPFTELAELARAKAEQVIGDKVKPAQEPAWPSVQVAAQALFAATKDLRAAGILHLALTKTSGLPGFETGFAVIRGLLDRYWDTVHPMLDAEDDNDPTLRVNSLVTALSSEEVLAALRTATLVESRQFGRHSLRSYRIATGTLKPVDEEVDTAQELSRIEAAFADAPVESLAETLALVTAASDHLNAIQHVLLDKAGGLPDDLKPLSIDLKEMKSLLEAQLAKRGGGESAAALGAAESSAPGQPAAASGPAGPIRSRRDVEAAIDRICEYYANHEPSSPVPLLLKRAKRLVNKSFMEIVRDLTPGGVSEAETLGGLEKEDG